MGRRVDSKLIPRLSSRLFSQSFFCFRNAYHYRRRVQCAAAISGSVAGRQCSVRCASTSVQSTSGSSSRNSLVFDYEVNPSGFSIPEPRKVPEAAQMHPIVQKWVNGVLAETESSGFHSAAAEAPAPQLLLVGPDGAGKLTNMLLAGRLFEEHGLKVVYTTGSANRTYTMGAIHIFHFLGLRLGDSIPVLEQMVGTFKRHSILLSTKYEDMFPSLAKADILLIDSMQYITAEILTAIDIVAREVRGPENRNRPFGGLRIFGGANFWRISNVSPISEYSGYLYQHPEMDKWFTQFYISRVFGQDLELNAFVTKAHLGELTADDVHELESRSLSSRISPPGMLPPTPMLDYVAAYPVIYPRFPKQGARRVMARELPMFRRSEFGSFLSSCISGNLSFTESFGLFDRLSVDSGMPVHINYAFGDIPAGEHGIVESIESLSSRAEGARKKGWLSSSSDVFATSEEQSVATATTGASTNAIVISFPRLRRTVTVYPVCFTIFHKDFPECRISIAQFPLTPRAAASGRVMIKRHYYYNVQIDGLYMTETNELGNLLAKMRTFDDFAAININRYLGLEGMVHEATRVYTRHLLLTGRGDVSVRERPQEWCRNCKSHVDGKNFMSHWTECLKQVRWCLQCNKRIPLSKFEAHREKHQIVICIDCGMPVEWSSWEQHRLSCPDMIFEISSDNELIPEKTRELALQMGLNRKDLHSVKRLTKSLLPRERVSLNTVPAFHSEALKKNVQMGKVSVFK